jgi:hypothetical protein
MTRGIWYWYKVQNNGTVWVLQVYCVFHLEPAVALTVFIFVITRPFLVFGVFVGLFRVHRRYDFLVGVILAKWGHFTPTFAPRALTESVRERA